MLSKFELNKKKRRTEDDEVGEMQSSLPLHLCLFMTVAAMQSFLINLDTKFVFTIYTMCNNLINLHV